MGGSAHFFLIMHLNSSFEDILLNLVIVFCGYNTLFVQMPTLCEHFFIACLHLPEHNLTGKTCFEAFFWGGRLVYFQFSVIASLIFFHSNLVI